MGTVTAKQFKRGDFVGWEPPSAYRPTFGLRRWWFRRSIPVLYEYDYKGRLMRRTSNPSKAGGCYQVGDIIFLDKFDWKRTTLRFPELKRDQDPVSPLGLLMLFLGVGDDDYVTGYRIVSILGPRKIQLRGVILLGGSWVDLEQTRTHSDQSLSSAWHTYKVIGGARVFVETVATWSVGLAELAVGGLGRKIVVELGKKVAKKVGKKAAKEAAEEVVESLLKKTVRTFAACSLEFSTELGKTIYKANRDAELSKERFGQFEKKNAVQKGVGAASGAFARCLVNKIFDGAVGKHIGPFFEGVFGAGVKAKALGYIGKRVTRLFLADPANVLVSAATDVLAEGTSSEADFAQKYGEKIGSRVMGLLTDEVGSWPKGLVDAIAD